ncbi:MAG: hypothetical protein KME11_14080 [Timaviella obliquedivisa GSE-PSE-MK23-08B]|jgi:hypothetical protein|nr:hypothetical protein [Timaviella obliquedivisa GSE-PSE-MK23-08B]
MSSSGRYQSRLFSFFSQQSLRLKDKTSQAWRQVKLAAVWSAQIALYPIYALFQTGRLLDRQMGQASRQVFPWLRAAQQQILNPSESNVSGLSLSQPFALVSDAPIQNLLAQNREEVTPLIQGFASLLANRDLVLVTAENEILDVLTGEQQLQLQRQIIWEMAIYWRQRRIQEQIQPSPENGTALQDWTNTFLPLPREKKNLLPPIRAFRHLMTWVQMSPVAIAINLFQESRLAALPSAPDPSLDPTLQVPLRSAHLPGSKLNQVIQGLLKERSERSPQLPLFAWVRRQATGFTEFSKSLGNLLQNSSIVLYDPLPKSEPEDFSLVSPTLSQPLTQKPWLRIEDFFGGEFLGVTDSRQIIKDAETAVQETEAGGAIAIGYSEEVVLSNPVNVTLRSSSSSALHQPAHPESGITSTILEAEVTGMSYEKHPLEQLLKWLDQGMLWIEQKLGQVWHWLHRT